MYERDYKFMNRKLNTALVSPSDDKSSVTNNASNQAEIVKHRLHYHFAKTDGTWDIPKDMPFMKEFLNEVKKLCDIVS